jgi:hypothetical protein
LPDLHDRARQRHVRTDLDRAQPQQQRDAVAALADVAPARTTVPFDLRPNETQVLEDEFVVLIPAAHTEDVVVSWRATATNVDATALGDFVLALDGADVNVFRTWLTDVSEGWPSAVAF